ncbi:hypothetical protein ACFO0A_01460 [Novosphingobium tardum]|uniref:Uncharacterized protein n=1 Tax=Novosphingobium tardum TaxID=1538021 RepID=A0ABV8RLQ3_9SPHN
MIAQPRPYGPGHHAPAVARCFSRRNPALARGRVAVPEIPAIMTEYGSFRPERLYTTRPAALAGAG